MKGSIRARLSFHVTKDWRAARALSVTFAPIWIFYSSFCPFLDFPRWPVRAALLRCCGNAGLGQKLFSGPIPGIVLENKSTQRLHLNPLSKVQRFTARPRDSSPEGELRRGSQGLSWTSPADPVYTNYTSLSLILICLFGPQLRGAPLQINFCTHPPIILHLPYTKMKYSFFRKKCSN